jgi:hypothetical protein
MTPDARDTRMLAKATLTAFLATANPDRAAVATLVERGVSFERYEFMKQDGGKHG